MLVATLRCKCSEDTRLPDRIFKQNILVCRYGGGISNDCTLLRVKGIVLGSRTRIQLKRKSDKEKYQRKSDRTGSCTDRKMSASCMCVIWDGINLRLIIYSSTYAYFNTNVSFALSTFCQSVLLFCNFPQITKHFYIKQQTLLKISTHFNHKTLHYLQQLISKHRLHSSQSHFI